MTGRQTTFLCALAALVLATSSFSQTPPPLVLENALFRYTMSSDAKNIAFVDRRTGKNHLEGKASPCALVRARGKVQPATSATLIDGHLNLGFGDGSINVILKVESRPFCVVLTVERVNSDEVEALTFLNIPLALKGMPDEQFGACAHSLNLFTRVDALPALQTELRASCEKKFGIMGAKVAIVAAPMDRMLRALQDWFNWRNRINRIDRANR